MGTFVVVDRSCWVGPGAFPVLEREEEVSLAAREKRGFKVDLDVKEAESVS